MNSLRIGGITPLSTVDWPGQLAAVLFLQGCPWRCAYCHNGFLQSACGEGQVSWTQVEHLLQLRQGLLDGVVFSGGEPTAQLALIDAVHRVRALGYAVGLHTAGIYPRRIAQMGDALDWVALDIKALPGEYDALTGVPGSHERVDETLDWLIENGKCFECRTTVDWTLMSPADLVLLGERLAARGVTDYSVQIARAAGKDYRPHRGAIVGGHAQEAITRLAGMFPRFSVRAA
jgi:pyruvate formate lyase activating enzyme